MDDVDAGGGDIQADVVRKHEVEVLLFSTTTFEPRETLEACEPVDGVNHEVADLQLEEGAQRARAVRPLVSLGLLSAEEAYQLAMVDDEQSIRRGWEPEPAPEVSDPELKTWDTTGLFDHLGEAVPLGLVLTQDHDPLTALELLTEHTGCSLGADGEPLDREGLQGVIFSWEALQGDPRPLLGPCFQLHVGLAVLRGLHAQGLGVVLEPQGFDVDEADVLLRELEGEGAIVILRAGICHADLQLLVCLCAALVLWIEGPQRLDLFIEELDPQGLSARVEPEGEDVSPDAELSRALDEGLSCVAATREAVLQAGDIELFADSEGEEVPFHALDGSEGREHPLQGGDEDLWGVSLGEPPPDLHPLAQRVDLRVLGVGARRGEHRAVRTEEPEVISEDPRLSVRGDEGDPGALGACRKPREGQGLCRAPQPPE